ncbi:MAG: hypothetical protein ACTSU3_09695 [Candidatus Thorarchaeota archaeon]
MSDRVLNFTGFKALRKKFSTAHFEKSSQMLIISSPSPHAVTSSALLSRAALKSGVLFHVVFSEPLVYLADIIPLIETHPNSIILLVGIDLIGNLEARDDSLVFIGGSHYEQLDVLLQQKTSNSVSLDAYAFVAETLKSDHEIFRLATLGALMQDELSKTSKRTSTEIVKKAITEKVVKARPGIKIPGTNHIPMNDALEYCIHPYLEGLSDDGEACQKLFDDADIPLTKWRTPINKLSNEEAKRFTSQMIALFPGIIKDVLGADYEFLTENPNGSLRLFSSVVSTARIVWSSREMGALLGVLMGDRAQMLVKLELLHKNHCKEVTQSFRIITILMNDTETTIKSNKHTTVIPVSGVPIEHFSDVGRILLTTNLDKEKFLILQSDSSLEIIWLFEDVDLRLILSSIKQNELTVLSTSEKSVRVIESSDEVLAKIEFILDEIGRSR